MKGIQHVCKALRMHTNHLASNAECKQNRVCLQRKPHRVTLIIFHKLILAQLILLFSLMHLPSYLDRYLHLIFFSMMNWPRFVLVYVADKLFFGSNRSMSNWLLISDVCSYADARWVISFRANYILWVQPAYLNMKAKQGYLIALTPLIQNTVNIVK